MPTSHETPKMRDVHCSELLIHRERMLLADLKRLGYEVRQTFGRNGHYWRRYVQKVA